jgi:hypothetical protein
MGAADGTHGQLATVGDRRCRYELLEGKLDVSPIFDAIARQRPSACCGTASMKCDHSKASSDVEARLTCSSPFGAIACYATTGE